jgi:hypothetical protein
MKKDPIMVRGTRIVVGQQELLLILADYPSLSKEECFDFIRQLVALGSKPGNGKCQPVIVWSRHDGTVAAEQTSKWKSEIDSRNIPVTELKAMPFSPG